MSIIDSTAGLDEVESSKSSITKGWRVKLYQLESEGAWQDQGTGVVHCKSVATLGPAICVSKEDNDDSYFLQSKIQCDDIYERQGESIIMWRDSGGVGGDVDYALSFQDTQGCLAIWEAIGEVQGQYLQHRLYNQMPMFYRGESEATVGITLPECSHENLQEIRDKLVSIPVAQREAISIFVMENDAEFLKKLFMLFNDLEDLDDAQGLAKIAEISRAIILLNDTQILSFVTSKEVFIHLAGLMEYDPALKEKADFREYLSGQAKFREVIPIEDLHLKNNIENLFRLKYLRDIMLRPSIDESGASALNSMIQFVTNEICTQIFENTLYLSKILALAVPSLDSSSLSFCNPPTKTSSASTVTSQEVASKYNQIDSSDDALKVSTEESPRSEDALRFLRELFSLSRNLTAEKRVQLISSMMKHLRTQFFEVVLKVLASEESTCTARICIAESLSCVVMACPSSLRQTIVEGAVPTTPPYVTAVGRLSQSQQSTLQYEQHNKTCLLHVIIQRIVEENETPVIEQLGDTLKIILDQYRFDRREKDKFLSLFYDYYVHWMVVPFVEPHFIDKPTDPIKHPQDSSAIAVSRRFILEIFSSCVLGHTYRMKYFVIRNNVLGRVLRVFDSPHQYLHLAAIRLVRTILSQKDDFYFRHIVKFDLLCPIMNALKASARKDNIITSAITELIEYIRTEGLRTLIEYIVDKYATHFQSSDFAETFNRLRLKHDQMMDASMAHKMGGNSSDSIVTEGSQSQDWTKGTSATSIQNQRFIERDEEEAYFFSGDEGMPDEGDGNIDSIVDNFGSGELKDGCLVGGSDAKNPLAMLATYYKDDDEKIVLERCKTMDIDNLLKRPSPPSDEFPRNVHVDEVELEDSLPHKLRRLRQNKEVAETGNNSPDNPRNNIFNFGKVGPPQSINSVDGNEENVRELKRKDSGNDSPPLPPLRSKIENDDDLPTSVFFKSASRPLSGLGGGVPSHNSHISSEGGSMESGNGGQKPISFSLNHKKKK